MSTLSVFLTPSLLVRGGDLLMPTGVCPLEYRGVKKMHGVSTVTCEALLSTRFSCECSTQVDLVIRTQPVRASSPYTASSVCLNARLIDM